ncbi:MAG: hypothetical protein ABJH04_18625 [Cyclobacteriaceae bacterium]
MELKLKLYKFITRKVRYFKDTRYRNYLREIQEDLRITKRKIGKWGKDEIGPNNVKGYFAILSFTRVPIYAKFHAVVGKILQLSGYTPLIITNRGNAMAFDYYRYFGINDFIYWTEYEEARVNQSVVQELVDLHFPQPLTIDSLISLQYETVDIGKHALSMVCRKRLEGQLDLTDSHIVTALREYMGKAITSVLATKCLLNEFQINKMLVRDSGYIPNGGIFEYALSKKVDCVVHEFGQQKGTWVFKRHTVANKNEHYFSLSDAAWKKIRQLEWTDQEEHLLQQEFKGRYKPESLYDTRRLQFGKKYKTPAEVQQQLNLDPSKKTAVIFSHIAWDAAFFYGTCIFGDYERWLFETVKYVAINCPDMNWIVKLHPFNAFKLQREEKSEESEMRLLRELQPLPSHVIIMRADTDINTQSLFPVVNYVLTVNGTVGMEFPCHGITSVLAGTGRYNGRGFTIDAESIKEYFSILDQLHTTEPLTNEQVLLAKKHYYFLMKYKQTNLEDIIPMELKKFHEAQSELHNNITINSESLEEFMSSTSVKKLSEWFVSSTEYDLF